MKQPASTLQPLLPLGTEGTFPAGSPPVSQQLGWVPLTHPSITASLTGGLSQPSYS